MTDEARGPARGTTPDPDVRTASGDFAALISRFDPPVPEIATRARALIAAVLPGVVEVVWEHQGTIGYGTGPRKMSEHFCYLALYPRHLNLGFNHGAELADPAGLLHGSGALMRSRRITAVEQLDDPALRDLIGAASRHRVPPLEP